MKVLKVKISRGISNLLKRKKVDHFSDIDQFNSTNASSSYHSHFNDAQVSEIAELSLLKK